MTRNTFSLKLIPISLSLVCLLFTIWLQLTPYPTIKRWLNQFNHMVYDMQLRANLSRTQIDPLLPIVIVDIDDESLKEQGRWPWSRDKMAELVQRLFAMGATVVALDLIFPEPERNSVQDIMAYLKQQANSSIALLRKLTEVQAKFDYDQQFAHSLARGDSVLGIAFHANAEASQGLLAEPLLTLLSGQGSTITQRAYYLGNIPVLQKAATSSGFINAFADDDGIIRRAQLIMRYQHALYPSLALEATRLFILAQSVQLVTEQQGKQRVLEGIKLDQQFIPTDSQGQVLIPFRGLQGSFPYISATDILQHKTKQAQIKNKLVFIGATAAGLGDLHATAVQSVYAGVEVHANIAAGILNNYFPHRPAWAAGAELLALIFLGLSCALIFPYLGPGLLLLSASIISVLLFWLDGLLWQQYTIVLSIIIPIILIVTLAVVNLAYGYLSEGRRREQLKLMFGQYVPAEHVDQMLQQKGDYGFSGETREMSVLFADIRNFTTISEQLEATQLKEMLNQFFTPMTQIIFNRQGTIDKYVGDMIMAFWGAPLQDRWHAKHAIEAALDMQQMVKRLLDSFKDRYGVELKIGIGINTGQVNVGDMGSEFRRSYTVIGDNVNLASRLEGLSKFYGVGIIVGENTYQLCQDDFIFRPLDRVKVKGKEVSVEVFEPICSRMQISEALLAELHQYQQALHYYYAQQWQEAEQLLTKLHTQFPQTYIYTLYLSRISVLRENPPSCDWDGVYVSMTK